MIRLKLSPITEKRLKIFRRNRIASFSLLALIVLFVFSLGAELIANDKPYIMKYDGRIFFPIVREPSASELGIGDTFKVDYRKIDWSTHGWAISPPVKFNPFQSNESVTTYPSPPTLENPMGTDDRGRDVFSRLLYGFRISFIYALGVWAITYILGVSAGLSMGFFGGKIDFLGQRVIEVISSIPQFFLLIILVSIFEPSMRLLVAISAAFGWITIGQYMRAEGLRLRKLEFVEGARSMGLPTSKILIKHVLPNALTPIITFSPFAIAAGITGLAALDYLGFGLAPPTPSWGELLNQAKKNFTTAWWLAFFPSMALFSTLTLLNFVGEGLRNAFDPKRG
ncbi:ABC transporter permease subunit [bacterium]|nr:ABC transporter permease subunit [bacterium]